MAKVFSIFAFLIVADIVITISNGDSARGRGERILVKVDQVLANQGVCFRTTVEPVK